MHIQYTELGLLGKSYRERDRPCFILSLFFRLRHIARGILVPHPGIKPVPPTLEVQSPNHWQSLDQQGRPRALFQYENF